MSLRPPRILFIVLGAAVFGFAVFGILASRVTTIEKLEQDAVRGRFQAVIDSLDSGSPRLTRDGSGGFTNTAMAAAGPVAKPSKLGVLFFHANEKRLVRSDIPFWFFRLKGPAAQFALRGSGFDMERLGITPKDIASQGPGVILDETSGNGDRLLVWAE
jgi:hypothetical protein